VSCHAGKGGDETQAPKNGKKKAQEALRHPLPHMWYSRSTVLTDVEVSHYVLLAPRLARGVYLCHHSLPRQEAELFFPH